MIAFKVMVVPARLLFGTAKVSAKAGYRTAKGSARAGYAAGRAVGYGRVAVFAAGLAVGLLAASPKARAAGRRAGSTLWNIRESHNAPSDGEITDQIRRHLAGAQTTWQLAQPTVSVQDGLVRLDGDVPDADARRSVGEAAARVEGVREVDNRVVIAVVADQGEDPDPDVVDVEKPRTFTAGLGDASIGPDEIAPDAA